MWDVVRRFHEADAKHARADFDLGEDGRDWAVALAKKDIADSGPRQSHLTPILYRPFDVRFTYWTGKTKGFLAYPRREVMQHIIGAENVGLIFNRQVVGDSVSTFGVSRIPICHGTFYLGNKGQDYFAPLYVTETDLLSGGKPQRRSNITPKALGALKSALGAEPGPDDVFNYLVGLFHSPTFRSRYAELLKQDFPRVPLTPKKPLFSALAKVGAEIASLHLLDSTLPQASRITFVGSTKSEVSKASYDERIGTLWFDKDKTAGFRGVTREAWDARVGGYQVCEKWLKDRKGRSLSKNEIEHFQLVLDTLTVLQRLMNEVDAVIAKHGGWPGAFATKASAS
jgi:predicted helicase